MLTKKIFQHIGFWMLFLLLWSIHDLVYHDNLKELFLGNLYTYLPHIVLVYLNLYWLMPRFLFKKEHSRYLILLGTGILGTTLVSSWNHAFFFRTMRVNADAADFFLSGQGKIAVLTDILVLVGLTMTLFLLREWYQKERYARTMEQKRLESELHLLKSQINPHFLFNSLNSIYVMLGKDYHAGRNMLLQFSDILSYQLYETNKERVDLKHEVDNLQKYIDIEKIRHADLATAKYAFPQDLNGYRIAPMLLLPIVENAFKHGQSSDGYWIDIQMGFSNPGNMVFQVHNSFPKHRQVYLQGIGLANLKRRLSLLYPDRYHLDITEHDGIFKVHLNLQLNE